MRFPKTITQSVILSSLIVAATFFLKSDGLDISHTDLDSANKICGVSSSCNNNDSAVDSPKSLNIWEYRNCQCDQNCVHYGDCCVDSPLYDASTHRRAVSSFSCEAFDQQDHVYTKKWCPPSWKNTAVRRLCEGSNNNSNNLKSTFTDYDPLLHTPVTSLRGIGITYPNVYCARCNDDYQRLQYWQMNLTCYGLDSRSSTIGDRNNATVDDVAYNSSSRSWQTKIGNEYYRCNHVVPKIPTALENGRYVRTCLGGMVQTCSNGWSLSDIRNNCEGYTSVVFGNNNKTPYRNVHCGICNNVAVQKLNCTGYREPDLRFGSDSSSFTILFDFGKCNDGSQLYDPFSKKCRDLLLSSSNNSNNGDGGNNNNTGQISRNLSTGGCSKYVLTSDEYVYRNSGLIIYVPQYNRTFESGSFIVQPDGSSIVICDKDLFPSSSGSNPAAIYKPPYFGLLTIVGIGLSILCLVAHLSVFSAVDELRNLSGMNLASYCVALMIAYISFILSDFAASGSTKLCLANAIIMYYFFLAAFFWMTTIAFDVWRALRVATSELRISSGKQWKKFVVYSCWSWLMPACVVLTSVLVDMSPKGGLIDDRYRPHFGSGSACWFGRGPALLVFFGLPLCAIMSLNFVFFGCSACMIYSSQSMTVYSAGTDTLKNFKLFLRLAVIMGLTWITGLIGGALDNEFVWVIFIVLNTLQGLFVFVGFSCRRRVLKALKEKHRRRRARRDGGIAAGNGGLHLPNFSLSVSSSNETESTKIRKSSGNIITNVAEY